MKLEDISRSLAKQQEIQVVCERCSKQLFESDKKIVVGEVVYCEEDALGEVRQLDETVKNSSDLDKKLLFCRIKGILYSS